MIYAYGITQQGTYHVKKGIVCQDAHRFIKCGDSYGIAAVADGLGSEEHSDIASQLAVELSTEYCAEHIQEDLSEEQILRIIRDSFACAQSRIEQAASDNGHDLDQYDTTLTLAVLRNGTLYYGQSGDSGMVALTAEGLYQKVTEQQRDEEGRVFPLYFGDAKWVFGTFPEPVVSVLLATDGIFETLFPVYLREEPVKIYVALARYLMGPDSLRIEEIGENGAAEKIDRFLAGIPDDQVNDDKTVVVLVDPDAACQKQEPGYYAEPDWSELKRNYEEAWRRAAYPHLFPAGALEDDTPEQAAQNTESAVPETSPASPAEGDTDAACPTSEAHPQASSGDGTGGEAAPPPAASLKKTTGKGRVRKLFSKRDGK